MKCLFFTYLDFNNRTGLFFSTHERIKNSIPYLEIYTIYNFQFYDSWALFILKKLIGKKTRKKGKEESTFENINYKNIWIKRGIFSSTTPWYYFDRFRNIKLFCNENFKSKKIIHLIKNEKIFYDFIMAHWSYPSGLIAKSISEYFKIPYFVTYHGSDINILPRKNNIYRNSIIEILKNAELNFFVSNALYKVAQTLTTDFNASVSYNGVQADFMVKYDHTGSRMNNNNIIFIGNLNKVKGADKLPQIFKSVVSKTNEIFNFTIIGNGEYELYINESLKESDVNYSITGYLERDLVIKNLHNSKILILPSRNEGLPLVILEAIACGVIPIASNVGGISEILESKFLVDLSETFINDFANKIIEISKENVYPSLQINEFSWENIIKKDMELINRILYRNDNRAVSNKLCKR